MRRRVLLPVVALVFAPSAAVAEEPPIALVKPGAGYLVTGGATFPLEILIPEGAGTPAIEGASITASRGKVARTEIVGPFRVRFFYTPPAESGSESEETIAVRLSLAGGAAREASFAVSVPEPEGPEIALAVEPDVIDASRKEPIAVTAHATGSAALAVFADPGTLSLEEQAEGEPKVHRGRLLLPELPSEAPSHIVVLAVASGPRGFSVVPGDLFVRAPIDIRVDSRPGAQVIVRGAENDPPPKRSADRGPTVLEDVVVRYGKKILVFVQKGGGRRQISVVLPTGLVSGGLVAPIPGQAVADGGTGPTILVAVPPSPFGGPALWPEVRVEGARLVEEIAVHDTVHALVIERPAQPLRIEVLLDDQPEGFVDLEATEGEEISIAATEAAPGERGAVEISVRDARGNPADTPEPRVRVAGGAPLETSRVAPGRYRTALASSTPGDAGTRVRVIAELPRPPLVAGDALGPIQAERDIPLVGTAPALEAAPEAKSAGTRFALLGAATLGSAFGSLLVVGGGVLAEVRPPLLDHRLALRIGAEFLLGSAAGVVEVDEERSLGSRTTVAGFAVPFDLGFAVLETDTFELLVRAGVSLRIEESALEVEGDRAAGSRRIAFGARAGLEGAFSLGVGAIVLAVVIDGIGVNAGGLSSQALTLAGSLATLRGELGYRFWF